ncbi:MAG TPA: single-stranded DNA-binding protein [Streptosporangiaceae bacterium]|nr:single-stranded DNA-binding protein [Streptosporangiaceae bacterium]
MLNDSQITLAGFVASEPAFKRLAGGSTTTTLRVAWTPRHISRETGEWVDGQTSFVSVQCWRTLATNVAVCLRKGEPVLVTGRLRVRPYHDKDGAARIAVEIDASSVGHDLNRGVAHFSRTRRAPGETAAEGAAESAAGGAAEGAEALDVAEDQQPGAGDGDGRILDGEDGGAGADRAGADAGDSVLDEQAVAEFAREMNSSLGEVPV